MSETKELAISPRTFNEVQSMAEVLSKSSLLPDALKNKASDVAFAIMAGAELGLSPVASIRGIHIISGKPTLSADTMVAVVLASGLAEYFSEIECTPTSTTWETKRRNAPVAQRRTWTLDDAKRAALDKKDVWRQYTRQMLAARCRSELARLVYPDLLAGVQSSDEVRDIPVERTSGNDVIDAELATTEETVTAQIDAADSHDALRAIGESLKTLPEHAKADARKRYQARWEQLQPKEAAP